MNNLENIKRKKKKIENLTFTSCVLLKWIWSWERGQLLSLICLFVIKHLLLLIKTCEMIQMLEAWELRTDFQLWIYRVALANISMFRDVCHHGISKKTAGSGLCCWRLKVNALLKKKKKFFSHFKWSLVRIKAVQASRRWFPFSWLCWPSLNVEFPFLLQTWREVVIIRQKFRE